MAYEVNGKTIETNDNGYLLEVTDWDESVAEAIAASEEIELTDKHWDVLKYLRDQFINNAGNQPNERTIVKDMKDVWGSKPSSKDMYQLFPGMTSKQGGKIAGLPESRRKGGY